MGTEKFSKHKDLLYIRYKLHGKLLADPFWNSVERDIFFLLWFSNLWSHTRASIYRLWIH